MDENNNFGVLAVQKTLLSLLKVFDELCVSESVDYTLSSGSLLGAVRQDGFIPWDDDIDIVIDRDNYNKLKRVLLAQSTLCIRKNHWLDCLEYVSSQSIDGFIPNIDIFIWDAVPRSHFIAKVKFYAIAFLQGMIKKRPEYNRFGLKDKFLLAVSYLVGRLFPMPWKLRWYSSIAQWGNKDKDSSGYLASYFDQFKGLKYHFRKELLLSFERRPFESIMASCMTGYDEYLRTIYGDDYLTPPQRSERHPQHM